jgi:hypothetical protein
MNIEKYDHIYVIENLFSKGSPFMAEILQKLKVSENDIILFKLIESYNFEKIDEVSDGEYLIELFVDDLLSFNNKNRKEKIELEIKQLFRENGSEDLYNSFLVDPFSTETKVLKKIMFIINRHALLDATEHIPDYVKRNVVFKNNTCFYFEDFNNFNLQNDMRFNNIWYENKTTKDLIQAIEYDLGSFEGIIISNDKDFNDFYCAFEYYETADDYNLGIYFKGNIPNIDKTIANIKEFINK